MLEGYIPPGGGGWALFIRGPTPLHQPEEWCSSRRCSGQIVPFPPPIQLARGKSEGDSDEGVGDSNCFYKA